MLRSSGLAEPGTPRRTLSRIIVPLAKLALSVGLMAFVLRDTSLVGLWRMLQRVQPLWLVAALAAHPVVMAVSVWRWRILLRAPTQIRTG